MDCRPQLSVFCCCNSADEILKALLNADMIGFHTFDYARHFLSCCSRILGLEFESKRGHIGLDYCGRVVSIKIRPAGVHVDRLLSGLHWPECEWRAGELRAQYADKQLLLGIDDFDIFQGTNLKLQAFECLLRLHEDVRGRVCLLQVVNPGRSRGKLMDDYQNNIREQVQRINSTFGFEGYEPVTLLERYVPLHERIAMYGVAQCVIVTAVRDGLNLVPYEYIVCRHAAVELQRGKDPQSEPPNSMLVVSEFIGCSPSLSGAIRVNPWNIENVADGMYSALVLPVGERSVRHLKHYKYVAKHTAQNWGLSFAKALERVSSTNLHQRCYGLGFGLNFRVVAMDPNFRKLETEVLCTKYAIAQNRLILLDYDGTLVPSMSIQTNPTREVLSVLDKLSKDPKNIVYIVSGRGRTVLHEWFSGCKQLGLKAEHGFFTRENADAAWTVLRTDENFGWMSVAKNIIEEYTETTDGSYIEEKESAIVWHYRDVGTDFGGFQAKELLDHLEGVLANEPVEVVGGKGIIEVKPQGVSKGLSAENLIAAVAKLKGGGPDFLLCIGDDRSDEEMFQVVEAINHSAEGQAPSTEVFACTVGQKPSKATYYLNDPFEVVKVLEEAVISTSTEAQ